MTTDNKYYTPAIEEFHVGFEYEHGTHGVIAGITIPYDHPDALWFEQTFDLSEDSDDLHTIMIKIRIPGTIRVPYLTPEDIKAEGWHYYSSIQQYGIIDKEVESHSNEYFKNGSLVLFNEWTLYDEGYNKYLIQNLDGETVFHGTIKNKSEFKKILKMITT